MADRLLIVFDGDDTLWATEALYDLARARIRRVLCSIGMDAESWDTAARRLDLDRVALHGYAWHRFPLTCVLAMYEVESQASELKKMLAAVGVFAIALGVFWKRPCVMPFAEHTLSEVSAFADVVLLTKGQRWVQRRRIRQSGLRRYFVSVRIVPEKSRETFESIAREHNCSRRVSVGNSFASDIAPALAAGYSGIRIDTYTWEHEHRRRAVAVASFAACDTLAQVGPIIRQLSHVARPILTGVN